MSQTAQDEIKSKVAEWKKVFKAGIEEMVDVKIEKPEEMSYVELLGKAADSRDFSSGDVYMICQHAVKKLGVFSREAQAMLSTPGYQEARDIALYVKMAYDENMFEKQVKAGPIIAKPDHLPGQKFGMIFHNPNFPTLEILYESKDADELARPDVFLMAGAFACSIKAVRDLAENPVLKKSLESLNLG